MPAPSDPCGEQYASVPKWKTLSLVLVVVVLNAVGNLSLAWGMKHFAGTVLFDPLSYLKAMLNPFVALGIILLILWLLTRMALLSWADLSFVLPLTGLGYILAAIFGNWFLDEKVTPIHWMGTILVFVGSGLVGATTQKTDAGQESE